MNCHIFSCGPTDCKLNILKSKVSIILLYPLYYSIAITFLKISIGEAGTTQVIWLDLDGFEKEWCEIVQDREQ